MFGQGEHLIFISKESVLAEKLVEEAHIVTIHGEVTLTMAKIRSEYWIPSLRQLVKKTIKKCYGCKRFQVRHYPQPSMGLLPVERSLTKAIHLELLPNQSTPQFIMALKRLIARRDTASVIYSDKAKNFVAASKGIGKTNKDEKMQEYLIKEQIKWNFNLSRVPWWGGQFERMVVLAKQPLFKATGRANLTKQELEKILMGIEVVQNNRPLIYIEENIQRPVLTPNTLLYGQPIMIPEERLYEDTLEIKRHQRYINKCKEAAWKRWKRECLRSIQERHNMMSNTKEMKIEVGDMVLIKGEEKNKGKWSIGIVAEMYMGKFIYLFKSLFTVGIQK